MPRNFDSISIHAQGEQMVEFFAFSAHRTFYSYPIKIEIFNATQGSIRVPCEVHDSVVIRDRFETDRLLGALVVGWLGNLGWYQIRVPADKDSHN